MPQVRQEGTLQLAVQDEVSRRVQPRNRIPRLDDFVWGGDSVVRRQRGWGGNSDLQARHGGGGDSSVNGNLQKATKFPDTHHASAHPLWTFREALEGSGSMQDGAGLQRGVKQPTDVCGRRIEIQSLGTSSNQSPQPGSETR